MLKNSAHRRKHQLKKSKRKIRIGFTLVELLVVIAIIAVISAAIILVVNPIELLRRSRDSTRLHDLTNITKAINIALQDSTVATVNFLCAQSGSYPCGGGAPAGNLSGRSNVGTRVASGTGWVKINLTSSVVATLSTLPVDPTNDATYHYTYCANNDNWEINTVLESNQSKNKMATDGGDQNATDTTGRYEVGTSLTLITSTGSPCSF